MPTKKLHDRQYRHDKYYKKAKVEGFAGRAIYKLEEINARAAVLKPSMRVLDLGCWPGSWLQYAAKVVGPKGVLVGVDRFPVEIPMVSPPLRMLLGDVFSMPLSLIKGDLPGFDVVLSDMAPDTTGIRSTDQARSEALFGRALDIASELLLPGGSFVGKLFQGPDWNALLMRTRSLFQQVRLFKPESTRKDSLEQYVVGLRRKASV